MIKVIILGMLALIVSGCGESEPPYSLERYDKEYRNPTTGYRTAYLSIVVTSESDALVINGITVNRGNCSQKTALPSGHRSSSLPRNLSFGQKAKFSFNKGCSAAEVSVDTDLGSWTHSF